jgi:hypothetical protein
MNLTDIEVEEGYSATFKVKVDFGYPKSRVLFYRNGKLLLNDSKHEICKCNHYSSIFINLHFKYFHIKFLRLLWRWHLSSSYTLCL